MYLNHIGMGNPYFVIKQIIHNQVMLCSVNAIMPYISVVQDMDKDMNNF